MALDVIINLSPDEQRKSYTLGFAMKLFTVALAIICNIVLADEMPLPFTRELSYDASDLMTGSDVSKAQFLLARAGEDCAVSGTFDESTESAVSSYQNHTKGLGVSGVLDASTAQTLLDCCLADGYRDNGTSAGELGYLYKVYVPVHANRSIETTATLFDADNKVLHTFTVRAHGYRDDGTSTGWPDFGDGDFGLNEFTSDGNTITGLATMDLNSPEPSDYEAEYGPYPINRVVGGLSGNLEFLYPSFRSGILLHTGEWPGWDSSMSMPNSEGCLHAHPEDIDTIWQLLVDIGVQINDNPGGAQPYPYTPQGIVSIELADE